MGKLEAEAFESKRKNLGETEQTQAAAGWLQHRRACVRTAGQMLSLLQEPARLRHALWG